MGCTVVISYRPYTYRVRLGQSSRKNAPLIFCAWEKILFSHYDIMLNNKMYLFLKQVVGHIYRILMLTYVFNILVLNLITVITFTLKTVILYIFEKHAYIGNRKWSILILLHAQIRHCYLQIMTLALNILNTAIYCPTKQQLLLVLALSRDRA